MKITNGISAMSLGTVQLGMNYGIANNAGKPSEETAFSILRTALEKGVTSLDTARGYGDSEDVIGRFLKTWQGETPFITTKILDLQGDTAAERERFAAKSVETSLEKLGVSKVNAVLLHRASDMFLHGKETENAMKTLVKLGYTDQVGASIYSAEDIREMLRYEAFTATQVPMSIFDQRLIADGSVEELKKRDYTVFVRSVFLQGLFFLDPEQVTDPILLEHAVPGIRRLRAIAEELGLTVAQLAIAFMRDCGGVTSLVLGADNASQVASNAAYFDTPTLDAAVVETLKKDFARVDIPAIMQVLSRPKK